MANYFADPCIALTGGGDGALDAIDGATVSDGCFAVTVTGSAAYMHQLDEDSALAESSPWVIKPDSNAGDKRWILRDYRMTSDGVSFTQSGTGAAARSLTAKLQDWKSVKDFGAYGDDSHDDTAAIQAAMDVGGNIWVPNGTYRISDTLLFKADGVHLCGESQKNAVIKQMTNAKTSFANNLPLTTTRLWCGLESLQVTGGAALGANPVINWKSMQFGLLRYLWLTGQSVAGCVGVNLEAVWGTTEATYNRIERLYVGSVAIGIDMGDGANSNVVRDSRFQIDFATGIGILLDASVAERINSVLIEGNAFEYPGNVSDGINVFQNTKGVHIIGNRFESLNNGIVIGATSNQQVFAPRTMNYFSGCTTDINNSGDHTVYSARAAASIVGATGALVGPAHNFTVVHTGAGVFTLSFVENLPDTAYTVSVSSDLPRTIVFSKAVGSVVVKTYDAAGNATDPSQLDVAVFHNL